MDERSELDMLSGDSELGTMAGPVTSPPVIGDTLRLSYLFTLPFFTTVACLSNFFIVCIFSTEKMKKYRASLFFRFVALVDVANSLLVFGVMWLAIVLPLPDCMPSTTALHCQLYTVFRYTVQDLSAWGLVFLLLERCLSEKKRKQKKKTAPQCVVVTVGSFQWVLRHAASKVFLFSMTLQALLLNLVMVYETEHELNVKDMMQCFSTWKVPQDFSFGFRSLAMKHSLSSVVFPSVFCVLTDVSMHLLLSPQRKDRTLRPNGRPVTTPTTVDILPPPPARPPAYTPTATTTQTAASAHRVVSPCRWTRLLGFRTSRDASASPSTQQLVRDDSPYDVTRASDVIVNGCEDASSEDGCRAETTHQRSFRDRFHDIFKSRDVPLSVVCVEDSRLAADPSDSLNNDFNAMASVAALFFVLMMQPQMLYLTVAGLFTISPAHWPMLKKVGVAVDLIVNNRISFPLFLYMIVSGRRVSGSLLRMLGDFLSFCCPCLAGLTFPAPAAAAPSVQPGLVIFRHNIWQGQGQGQHAEGQGRDGNGGAAGSVPQHAAGKRSSFSSSPWLCHNGADVARPPSRGGRRDQGLQVNLSEGEGEGEGEGDGGAACRTTDRGSGGLQRPVPVLPDLLVVRL